MPVAGADALAWRAPSADTESDSNFDAATHSDPDPNTSANFDPDAHSKRNSNSNARRGCRHNESGTRLNVWFFERYVLLDDRRGDELCLFCRQLSQWK